ncbi:hypothetical protein JCM14469_29250 [Desulfatiferula olefinivorans]
MLKQDVHERRKGLRVEFDTEVTVRAGGQDTRYVGSSRDLSLRGVFITTDIGLAEGTACEVEIALSGLEEKLVLCMDGHVVRTTETGYAIYFDSVDLETYTHLKNIVKYNAPDSEPV